jgi:hypothetical protein
VLVWFNFIYFLKHLNYFLPTSVSEAENNKFNINLLIYQPFLSEITLNIQTSLMTSTVTELHFQIVISLALGVGNLNVAFISDRED